MVATDNDCLSPINCCLGGGGSGNGRLALEEPLSQDYEYRDDDNYEKDIEGAAVPAMAATMDTNNTAQLHPDPTSESLWSWISGAAAAGGTNHNNEELPQLATAPTFLPILIIPGFMSSGLEIVKSQTRPDWEGKRIWINLGSLGLSSMYFGSAQQKQKQTTNSNSSPKRDELQKLKQQQQHRYKSLWLEHMRLNDKDLKSDPLGVQVRAMEGLEGVDYLSPGTLTNHVSYVFGPVIQALKAAGYQPGINLKAAPYDWRLSPLELEARDQYFSRTLQQVEEMYYQNHNTPVVLLGHSLGSKTAHYFLNFCLAHKGEAWLEQHIHTYMPVGAPHLGAPKALRSVVAGDKMGLDAFLSDEEALALGRSFGSGPWLFPSELPPSVPASVYVLPHGILEVRVDGTVNTHDLIHKRTAMTKPTKYQLLVELAPTLFAGRPAPTKKDHRTLVTAFHPHQRDRVKFTEQLSFATHPHAKTASQVKLRFYLQEPGIAVAKQERQETYYCLWPIICLLKWITCCCLCDYIYRILKCLTCGLLQGLALGADAFARGAGGGANLAFSEYLTIPEEVWTNGGKELQRTITVYHKDDYGARQKFCCLSWLKTPRAATIPIRIRWIPYDDRRTARSVGSPVCQPNAAAPCGLKIAKKDQVYQEFAGHDILQREGLDSTLELIRSNYDRDVTMGPRTKSSTDAPPVKRVHAIYGKNIPTEVGAVYKRKDNCLADHKLDNLYKLDAKGTVETKSGYTCKNGLLFETPKTLQSSLAEGGAERRVCGDGTVPYWSLQHCQTWNGPNCDVSVVELEKAEHREILADARFHKAILDYCRIPNETA